jgi:hypothetical protein
MRRSLSNPVDSEPKKNGTYMHVECINAIIRRRSETRKSNSGETRPYVCIVCQTSNKTIWRIPDEPLDPQFDCIAVTWYELPLNPAPHRSLEFFLSKKGQYLMTQDIRYPSHYRKNAFLILPHFFRSPRIRRNTCQKEVSSANQSQGKPK